MSPVARNRPAGRRRKLVRLTPRGTQALALSAKACARARWAAELGTDRVASLEAGLRTMAAGQPFRLDLPGWLGS